MKDYFEEHKTYFAHFTNIAAVREWQGFAEDLTRGETDIFEYWMTLSMRESFENAERTLSEEQWEEVRKADQLVRQHLVNVLRNLERLDQYEDLGSPRPSEYWWWHLT